MRHTHTRLRRVDEVRFGFAGHLCEPLFLLTGALPALACNTPAYVVEENVTVPPEVQQEFSASTPGFVMNSSFIYGV